MDEKELSIQESYNNTENESASPAQAAAEFLHRSHLFMLKSKLLGEMERIKGYPADNHLSYVVYKDARKLVLIYEEELYKYRENYKESEYSNFFLTDHDLKIIRQVLFMDEYEEEFETSSEYRQLIEEYERASVELEKSNINSKELPEGILTADEMEGADPDAIYDSIVAVTNYMADALAPATRWKNALTKLAEYEVRYKTINAITNSIISDMRKEQFNKAKELTYKENIPEKTDNDDATPTTPTTEEETNGWCIGGFILGISSVFFYWFFPILLPMLAVIVSGTGLQEVAETGEKGKGMGIWGLVLGIIYTIQSIIKLAVIGSI